MEFVNDKFELLYPQPPLTSELVDDLHDLTLIFKNSENDTDPFEYFVNKFTLLLYIGRLYNSIKNDKENKITILVPDKYIFLYYLNLIFNKDNRKIVKLYPNYMLNLKILELLNFLSIDIDAESVFYSIFIPNDEYVLDFYISILELYKKLDFYKFLSLKLIIDSPINNFSRDQKQKLINYLDTPMFAYLKDNKIYLELLQDKPFILTTNTKNLVTIQADVIGKYFILSYLENKKYYHNVYLTNGYLKETLNFTNEEIVAISPKSTYIITKRYLYLLEDGKKIFNFFYLNLHVFYAKFSYDDRFVLIKSHEYILIDISKNTRIGRWTVGDFIDADFTINNEELILVFRNLIIYFNLKTYVERRERFEVPIHGFAYSVYKKMALIMYDKVIIRQYDNPNNYQEYDIKTNNFKFTYNKNYAIYDGEQGNVVFDMINNKIINTYPRTYFTEISRIKIKENLLRSL